MKYLTNKRRMCTLLWICIILYLISLTMCMNPKFDSTTEMRLVLVPADAGVGTVIYRLRATDEEFDYPLVFELVEDSSAQAFHIESLPCTKYNSVCQANVVLKRRLEPGRYYDFHVAVKDTRGGTAVIMCSVTATNFTTPHDVIFPHKPGIIMVPENAKRGQELDYVIARKNPLYQKPVYLELWGSPLFAIRQKIVSPEMTEGTIFLLGPLDFEKQSMYHLTLLANDAYAEPGQDSRNIAGIEVVVIIEDVQDEPPIFTLAPPVTRLSSGLLPGDKILQVHAEDGDKGVPREIRYGLVSEGNPFTSFFYVNETTGAIKLVKPLDEISALTHAGDPVLLTVIAEEVKVTRNEPPAMSSTVQLALFLPERSNSPPYFDNDHYVARIDENAHSGTALIFPDPYVARVSDDDAGKNGVFSLTLLNNNGTFEISPNVAERKANFILAQELGPATNLSAIANVTVYINDKNDNPPVFDQNEYRIEIPENITVGTRIVQVHAEDVDTLNGGKIRYTQILGYLNTSLNLHPTTGIITVATSNHGFDREQMPEYHLYIVARDDDGAGNRAEIPLIIQLIDVNDETPTFEKTLYEFIMTPDLRDFTAPAYIKAIDIDAEPPNNVVRYEIIHGNYENKFALNEFTGRLTLSEKIARINQSQNISRRRRRQSVQQDLFKPHKFSDKDIFVLTARAFDLGVPVRWSTCTIRIYPPESKHRTVTFVVPGNNLDKQKTEDTLVTITGGRVIIQDMRPYTGQSIPAGSQDLGGDSKEKTLVVATVLYDSNSVVDIQEIQNKITKNGTYQGIIIRDDSAANVYRAENKVLFWLLMFFALLLALGILTLLFCCICSWCPLYAASRWQNGWEEEGKPGQLQVDLPIPVQSQRIGNLQEEDMMTKN
uniref:CSON011767 protein n=1 Tax=Culicoides sonorensis TaxID=179676 RepID=A0A336M400_CULSO